MGPRFRDKPCEFSRIIIRFGTLMMGLMMGPEGLSDFRENGGKWVRKARKCRDILTMIRLEWAQKRVMGSCRKSFYAADRAAQP